MRLIAYNKAFRVVGYAVIPPFHYSIEVHPVELRDHARFANLEALWAFVTDWNGKCSLYELINFSSKFPWCADQTYWNICKEKFFLFQSRVRDATMKLFRDVSHILKCQDGIKLFLPCFRFTLGGGVRQLVGYDAINLKVNSSHGFLHKPVTKA